MLDQRAKDLDRVFHALAHPVRRAILHRIAGKEHSITELAAPFDMTLEGVSQHIRVLEQAGLLRRTRRGRVHECRLDPRPLREATATLAHLTAFWEERLETLDNYLKGPPGQE